MKKQPTILPQPIPDPKARPDPLLPVAAPADGDADRHELAPLAPAVNEVPTIPTIPEFVDVKVVQLARDELIIEGNISRLDGALITERSKLLATRGALSAYKELQEAIKGGNVRGFNGHSESD